MSHTKGLWKLVKKITPGQFGTDYEIRNDDNHKIAEVGPCEQDSNSNLISAAPELLEVAELILKEWDRDHSTELKGTLIARSTQYSDLARAAVKKAKGL